MEILRYEYRCCGLRCDWHTSCMFCRVSPMSSSNVCSSNAYVLFYELSPSSSLHGKYQTCRLWRSLQTDGIGFSVRKLHLVDKMLRSQTWRHSRTERKTRFSLRKQRQLRAVKRHFRHFNHELWTLGTFYFCTVFMYTSLTVTVMKGEMNRSSCGEKSSSTKNAELKSVQSL